MFPDIVPGCDGVPGRIVIELVLAALVPQLFPAVTDILPLWPYEPVVTVIEVVP